MTRYLLTLADRTTAPSSAPGRFGGNRASRIYGRLDCPSAIRALARGYAKRRVFFADEATAIAAGYRPCAVCMPEEYGRWKLARRSMAFRVQTAILAITFGSRPAVTTQSTDQPSRIVLGGGGSTQSDRTPTT